MQRLLELALVLAALVVTSKNGDNYGTGEIKRTGQGVGVVSAGGAIYGCYSLFKKREAGHKT